MEHIVLYILATCMTIVIVSVLIVVISFFIDMICMLLDILTFHKFNLSEKFMKLLYSFTKDDD